MATLILVRHGRSSANTAGVLAGRSPGVALDDVGRAQVRAAGERLAALRLAAIVTSPLERCRDTAKAIAASQGATIRPTADRALIEVDYGDWQGRELKTLAKEPLWKTVQAQPSAATFPRGENLGDMQARAVGAVRRRDRALESEHGPSALWVAVSHGDVIKAILADALGLHLDLFQRIHVDPASISIIRYTDTRPFVLASNTHAGDLGWLAPPPASARRRKATSTHAVVGGGAGPTSPAS
jgi:probable phosphomutase (TIGR03848 family)